MRTVESVQERTIVNINGGTKQRKESPLGLFIAVIADSPDGDEWSHRESFMEMLFDDGYEDFLESVVSEWMSIKYSTALRAAKPPTIAEVKKSASQRRKDQARKIEAVSRAKAIITHRLLDMTAPNGKKLRDCTGASCVKFGGFYTKIGEAVGKRRKVGSVLSEEQLSDILKSA